ncbi:MAG: Chaperone protein DnaJ [Candidatus Thorarchaeota archaeon AB_25]|nr:MAG: Chaperone protein DnaJ [Candidatus Thorarchaeota archaeon AB_25]
MDRKRIGLLLVIIGFVQFFITLFFILPIPYLYLASLFMMFLAVVIIGVGAAFARGVDSSLDVPSDDCYYCKGTGKIKSGEEFETCPRCGGSGLARPDDSD